MRHLGAVRNAALKHIPRYSVCDKHFALNNVLFSALLKLAAWI